MNARDKMIQYVQRQTTPMLCKVLEDLHKQADRREAAVIQPVVIDKLCGRHPEVDAAFDRWAEQDNPADTAVQAIIKAAMAAAR